VVVCERLAPVRAQWNEEEGEYEYAADQQSGTQGKEEAHIEPAVLYQPLGEATSDDSFGEEWRRILIEYGSRCEQYGGHWKGHKCVGIRASNGKADCSAIASQVEAPMVWDPGTWIPYGVGIGLCQIF
jgi:hypothetical protein